MIIALKHTVRLRTLIAAASVRSSNRASARSNIIASSTLAPSKLVRSDVRIHFPGTSHLSAIWLRRRANETARRRATATREAMHRGSSSPIGRSSAINEREPPTTACLGQFLSLVVSIAAIRAISRSACDVICSEPEAPVLIRT